MAVLQATALTVVQNGQTILNNISFSVQPGEQWAIVGAAGTGKTTLLHALAGRQHFTGTLQVHDDNPTLHNKMVLVEQQHHFKTLSNTANFYYQQRFNSQDAGDAITVKEDLHRIAAQRNTSTNQLTEWVQLFDLEKLYDEPLIQLSNGENKRLQIVKALLLKPAFLLLDNPFTGLDVASRQTLENVLLKVAQSGIHIILVTAATHLPPLITHVLTLYPKGGFTAEAISNASYNKQSKAPILNFDETLLQKLTYQNSSPDFEYAVQMKNVHITYDKKILDNINWEVRKGERWSLSGPNGSGKSTLLSLVNADNPQAYANNIYLFDKKRGSGETIWDIKKKTGFVSPELHLYFERGISSFNVVASGLFDTIGLFRKINEQQITLVTEWMQLLQIQHLQRKFLFQLSNSEQRMVLLARALVKNPPLLILDEPCQGLDEERSALFKAIVNEICLRANKTMIYVSHYTADIPECVTHYIRLQDGKRVE